MSEQSKHTDMLNTFSMPPYKPTPLVAHLQGEPVQHTLKEYEFGRKFTEEEIPVVIDDLSSSQPPTNGIPLSPFFPKNLLEDPKKPMHYISLRFKGKESQLTIPGALNNLRLFLINSAMVGDDFKDHVTERQPWRDALGSESEARTYYQWFNLLAGNNGSNVLGIARALGRRTDNIAFKEFLGEMSSYLTEITESAYGHAGKEQDENVVKRKILTGDRVRGSLAILFNVMANPELLGESKNATPELSSHRAIFKQAFDNFIVSGITPLSDEERNSILFPALLLKDDVQIKQ